MFTKHAILMDNIRIDRTANKTKQRPQSGNSKLDYTGIGIIMIMSLGRMHGLLEDVNYRLTSLYLLQGSELSYQQMDIFMKKVN